MKIKVNGETKDYSPNPSNLQELIKLLGYQPQTIVVEFNQKIMAPKYWQRQELRNGDEIEIVTIVGGGS